MVSGFNFLGTKNFMVTSGNPTVENPYEKSMTFPLKTLEKNIL